MKEGKLKQEFKRLLSQGAIGKMRIKNRIVMAPMIGSFATPDGLATRQLIDYYVARARGGVGLVVVESTFVTQAGKNTIHELGINDDKCMLGLSELVSKVKLWRSKIIIQLHHAGRQTKIAVTGMPVVAPSAILCPVTGGIPRELTTEEVADVVEAFAQAASRAKQVGADGVEIHGAHGYLLNQFLSPKTNHRTDKYGGDLNGRVNIMLEIIKRSRELVGNDFIITARLNGRDYVAGGLELNESKQIAQKLEAAGIDGLHITRGIYESKIDPRFGGISPSMYDDRGCIVDDAAQIKSVVGVPVIAVGSITPEIGEEVLKQGKADFIAFGRALLADPELPNKLIRGEPESIRPCIRCNSGCKKRGMGLGCTVNAQVASESYEMIPPLKHKKVFIVGGGPAGMEAARIASLKGHDVTLYEKNKKLGGHLIEATVPDFKEDLRIYKDWLIREVQKVGTKIELGKEVTSQTLRDAKPDVLVVATGSTTHFPDIPGIDKPIVATAIDILLGKAQPGSKTIIMGGGAVGCEVALYLAQQSRKVTIVEMLPQVATDVPEVQGELTAKLIDNSVEIFTNLKVIGVTDKGVTATDRGSNVINVDGDRVILAFGLITQAKLYQELEGKVRETYIIGDCVEPRRLGEAIREGYNVGNIL
jgi:2,4-dienoyl-CoA reductase-like NADH-dependent reductase (Old Yellow Enzyme family)/thioredoxin reductase